MLNRSKLWAAVLLIAVFAAGVTVGGAAFSTWGPRDGAGDRSWERGDDRGRRPSYAERLETDLALTAEQREMVDTILAQTCRTFGAKCGRNSTPCGTQSAPRSWTF